MLEEFLPLAERLPEALGLALRSRRLPVNRTSRRSATFLCDGKLWEYQGLLRYAEDIAKIRGMPKPGENFMRCGPLSFVRCLAAIMIREYDRVVLTVPVSDHGLEPGDVGVVVHVYPRQEAYEVEFVTLAGQIAAIVTAAADQIRPIGEHEMLHARELTRLS